jgi:hypothetical protein
MWGRPDYDPRTPEEWRRLFWGIVIFIVGGGLDTRLSPDSSNTLFRHYPTVGLTCPLC